jgi:hypothetical protein
MMNKGNTKFAPFTALICLLAWTYSLHAEGITIEHANGRFKDSFYQVDAIISYELSDVVLDALVHGISLRFDVIVEIQRERDWIWDKNVVTAILSYQLEYLPLNDNYLVTNMVTKERNQLQDLNEALEFLGSVQDFPVINENDLEPDVTYNCFIMSELRIRNLPLPLQPLALISPNWNLSSPWYEWTIR